MRCTTREEKRYREFVQDILKSTAVTIDTATLQLYLIRHTQGYMGRNFFNDTLKRKYYRYWVKRLHQAGIISPKEGTLNWWYLNKDKKKKDE